MDVRDLQCVLTVADCGTLTAAAALLGVSRQAVAKTVERVESVLDGRLFERRAGALIPTAYGRGFLGEARLVVEDFRALCDRYATEAGPFGVPAGRRETLLVALVVGGVDVLPPGLFESYVLLNPQAMLSVEEMSTEAVLRGVAEKSFDVGIVGSHPYLLEGFEACPMQTTGVWLLAPEGHPLARRDRATIADLDGQPMVTTGASNHVHRIVMSRCAQEGVVPDIKASSTSPMTIAGLSRHFNALCFGFSPQVLAPPPGTVALELGFEGSEKFGAYAIRLRGGSSPAKASAQRFWKMLCAVGKAMV